MIIEPSSAADYDDRTVQAARSALIEIGQALGSYRDSFVVIGGSVPRLLFPLSDPQHVGTTDVDIGLDHEALAEGEYVGLVEALEQSGYERGLDGTKKFQLSRLVQPNDDGPPVRIILDLMMARDARPEKNKPPLLENFAVMKGDGVGLALENRILTEVSGTMPDGRNNTVSLHVATAPAFLVMKGFALRGRDKPKDAYDIYFTIRNFVGGSEALAEECRALLGHEDAACAYRIIRDKFDGIDNFGPSTVRKFLATGGQVSDDDLERIQTEAFIEVQDWARLVLGEG